MVSPSLSTNVCQPASLPTCTAQPIWTRTSRRLISIALPEPSPVEFVNVTEGPVFLHELGHDEIVQRLGLEDLFIVAALGGELRSGRVVGEGLGNEALAQLGQAVFDQRGIEPGEVA